MNRIASSLACLGLLAPALMAGSINFVGVETGSAVEGWSKTSVLKTRDLNGDNRFGGAGYYQIAPTNTVEVSYSQGIPDGNNLGINNAPSTTSFPTQFATPSFIAGNLTGAQGTLMNFSVSEQFFEQFYDPTGTTVLQQGVLWLNSENSIDGTIVDGSTSIYGRRNKAFSFTLSQAASFRLGVATDVMNASTYTPDYISVSNVITGEEFSTVLTRDNTPDMAFFDISGDVGDEFEVALWQTDDNGSGENVAFALVTFDKVPMLTYTQNGDSITLSWEASIRGWILQSSTDLGVADTWDTIPDLDNNNSVTVSMIGVPKNFFRLKTNP